MAKYRIEIDREACVGDGACVNEAPGTFELDEENVVKVINAEGNSPEEVLSAAQSCPTDAIRIFDAETGQKVWPEG